ncbi:MAG: hypothetical protein Q9184_005361 [Pyrenodesmia sp. 2 TL-2023]
MPPSSPNKRRLVSRPLSPIHKRRRSSVYGQDQSDAQPSAAEHSSRGTFTDSVSDLSPESPSPKGDAGTDAQRPLHLLLQSHDLAVRSKPSPANAGSKDVAPCTHYPWQGGSPSSQHFQASETSAIRNHVLEAREKKTKTAAHWRDSSTESSSPSPGSSCCLLSALPDAGYALSPLDLGSPASNHLEYPLGLRSTVLPLTDNRYIDGHQNRLSASDSTHDGNASGFLSFVRSGCPSPSPSYQYKKSSLGSYSDLDNSVLSAFGPKASSYLGGKDQRVPDANIAEMTKSIPPLWNRWKPGHPPFAAPEPITIFSFTTRGVPMQGAEGDRAGDTDNVGASNRIENEAPSFNTNHNSGLSNMSPVTVIHVPTMLSANGGQEQFPNLNNGSTTDAQSSAADQGRNQSQTVNQPTEAPRKSIDSAVSSLHPREGEAGPSNYQELLSPRQKEKSKASDSQQDQSLKSYQSADSLGAFRKGPFQYPRRDLRNYPHLLDMLSAAADPVGDLPSTNAMSSVSPTLPPSDKQLVDQQDSTSVTPDTTGETSGKLDQSPTDISASVATPEGIQYQFLEQRDNQGKITPWKQTCDKCKRRLLKEYKDKIERAERKRNGIPQEWTPSVPSAAMILSRVPDENACDGCKQRRQIAREVMAEKEQAEAERKRAEVEREQAEAEIKRVEAERKRVEAEQKRSDDIQGWIPEPAPATPSKTCGMTVPQRSRSGTVSSDEPGCLMCGCFKGLRWVCRCCRGRQADAENISPAPLTKNTLVEHTEQTGQTYVARIHGSETKVSGSPSRGPEAGQSQRNSTQPQSQGDETSVLPAGNPTNTWSLSAKGTKPASLHQQKLLLGKELWPKILILQPDFAGKITGLLLEMDLSELLLLTEDNEKLEQKVTETLSLLDHYVKTQGALPPSKSLEPSSNDAVSPKTIQGASQPQDYPANQGRRTVPMQRRGSGEAKTWSRYLEELEAKEIQQILDDLNDFISPGVACIKPVETLPLQKPEDPSNPYEVTTEDTLSKQDHAPAQISLTDCLACSGCVTSAEAVLVSLQSHSEVLNTLDSYPSLTLRHNAEGPWRADLPNGAADGKIFVASVSPQIRASIAATYGLSERRAGWMIDQLLSGSSGLASGGKHGSGFTWVVDTNAMREACLVLSGDEVVPSLLSSIDTNSSSSTSSSTPKKPILSSACPGWICYAEKTHPHVLPHLSRLKSPQALTGTLVKTVLSQRFNIRPDQIWHLAVMPCFDKKLEASREELTDIYWRPTSQAQEPTPPVRDVDCVITARELVMLADTRGISFPSLAQQPLPPSSTPLFPDPILNSYLFPHHHQNPRKRRRRRNQDLSAGPSGGYLHHVLQTQLALHPESTLHSTRGRNADVVEYTITRTPPPPSSQFPSTTEEQDETIFRAARYYGSRNITNLVRKLKLPKPRRLPGAAVTRPSPSSTASGKTRGPAAVAGASSNSLAEYGYIEVMACPGGCTNGGGQIKVDDVGLGDRSREGREGMSQKEWLAKVDEAYFSMSSDDSDSDSWPNRDIDAEGDTAMGEEGQEEEEEGREIVNGIDVGEVRGMLRHWSQSTGIALEKLCFTSFREVVSEVGKGDKGGGQERVVELAGRIGGGW